MSIRTLNQPLRHAEGSTANELLPGTRERLWVSVSRQERAGVGVYGSRVRTQSVIPA
jgi:hypothetical protein